jgi:NAD(P)-dependent dehydrogenase (short-subunit alcohol dehydrogenase family)
MRLHNKSIIVTGSTTGIGEAIARRAVEEGAQVLVHGRDVTRGEAVVRDLGGASALHVDDLADPAAAERIVAAALAAFGKIDALVNNAALVIRSNLANTTAKLFDQVLGVNVRAPLLLIQAAIDELRKTRGAVLNVGSVNAYCGETGLLAYSMAKGAMMTMTRNLSDALGYDGVRVNQINPGWVLTPNEDKLQRSLGRPADWPTSVAGKYLPCGRLIEPEEMAAAVVYWISDESQPITGSVVDLAQFTTVGRNPIEIEE